MFKVSPTTPHSMKRAIKRLFPHGHPQEQTPEFSDLMEEIKRKYPDKEYFRNSPSDRTLVSIGKMLYPDQPGPSCSPCL